MTEIISLLNSQKDLMAKYQENIELMFNQLKSIDDIIKKINFSDKLKLILNDQCKDTSYYLIFLQGIGVIHTDEYYPKDIMKFVKTDPKSTAYCKNFHILSLNNMEFESKSIVNNNYSTSFTINLDSKTYKKNHLGEVTIFESRFYTLNLELDEHNLSINIMYNLASCYGWYDSNSHTLLKVPLKKLNNIEKYLQEFLDKNNTGTEEIRISLSKLANESEKIEKQAKIAKLKKELEELEK
jgi:hypothetical protein